MVRNHMMVRVRVSGGVMVTARLRHVVCRVVVSGVVMRKRLEIMVTRIFATRNRDMSRRIVYCRIRICTGCAGMMMR
jgi:hypothetical protein